LPAGYGRVGNNGEPDAPGAEDHRKGEAHREQSTEENAAMQYILFALAKAENWEIPAIRNLDDAPGPEEVKAQSAAFASLMRETQASGELVVTFPLAAPPETRTMRIRDGVTAVTEGALGEVAEVAGIFVFDVRSPERMDELAARFPAARNHAVVYREVSGRSLASIVAAAETDALGAAR
jgi:hypothetical protein